MLVLSRSKEEDVVIPLSLGLLKELVAEGKDIEIKVKVVDVRGDKIRIGFDAPLSIPVHRAEVWDRIMAQAHMTKVASEIGERIGGSSPKNLPSQLDIPHPLPRSAYALEIAAQLEVQSSSLPPIHPKK